MMEKIYKDNEFMEYPKEKRVYNLSTEAIPIEFIKKYYEDITMPHTDTRIQFEELIRKWEKENERMDNR